MQITNLLDIPVVKSYAKRINAEERSLRTLVVREEGGFGYWRDVCVIKFSEEGDVSIKPDSYAVSHAPTEEELTEIGVIFKSVKWPEPVIIDLDHEDLPKVWRDASEDMQFIFRNEDGEPIMLQVRQDDRDGGKRYIPITFWDDGKFRLSELGGQIPLYGLENIKKYSSVLIVEGAKTAKYVQWLVDGDSEEARKAREAHPWGNELQHICVLGWSSGALSPNRTDWSPIRKNGIKRAYVALDNDHVGRQALPDISRNLRCITHAIEFSEEWPVSADLYDPFPDVFFKEINGKKYYTGPSFHDCLSPATYMTDLIPVPDAKKERFIPVLRPHVRSLYQYMEEVKSFCYLEMPDIIYDAETLDASMRPFSDTKKLSELLLANFNGRSMKFDYSPATTKRRIIVNGKPVVNLFTPSSIKPQEGDASPWLNFMEQLIPDADERHKLLRWIATLYAKPDVRMIYAPLLISNQTGTGKSTLGRICAFLVGMNNTSFPSEQAIAGEFNAWLVQKRLVVVNEVYQGQSWKMFNKLKDLITEETVTLRKMHRDPTDVSNWAHFLLFSNSHNALKIDPQDRRLFVPQVTEERWDDQSWSDFHEWLNSGGYSIIANWCLNFGDYVKRGERSPMTDQKLQMIEASQSKATLHIEELCRELLNRNEPISLSVRDVTEWIESVTREKVYETALQIRKSFESFGCFDARSFGVDRVSYQSRLTYFVCNKQAALDLQAQADVNVRKEMLKTMAKSPTEIMKIEEMM